MRADSEPGVKHYMDSTNKKPTRLNNGRTLFLLAVCGIVAFIVLIVQLYKVMIIDHDKYESAAVEQQVRETSITASRGTIYDSNMKMLAVSSSVDTIYISPGIHRPEPLRNARGQLRYHHGQMAAYRLVV